jgi:hypothetical protein
MGLPVQIVNLAFICSMCEHMAEAFDQGLQDCCHPECGGLPVGRTFPSYKGPLEKVRLEYCHRCGRDSTKILGISGGGRLGVCQN